MKRNNLLSENNNFNNLSLLLVNTFELKEFNLLLNNNNNSLPEGLDPNIVVLINVLTEMNLIGEHFSKEESFIKPIEFEEIETENLNKWLKRFNRIMKAK